MYINAHVKNIFTIFHKGYKLDFYQFFNFVYYLVYFYNFIKISVMFNFYSLRKKQIDNNKEDNKFYTVALELTCMLNFSFFYVISLIP